MASKMVLFPTPLSPERTLIPSTKCSSLSRWDLMFFRKIERICITKYPLQTIRAIRRLQHHLSGQGPGSPEIIGSTLLHALGICCVAPDQFMQHITFNFGKGLFDNLLPAGLGYQRKVILYFYVQWRGKLIECQS